MPGLARALLESTGEVEKRAARKREKIEKHNHTVLTNSGHSGLSRDDYAAARSPSRSPAPVGVFYKNQKPVCSFFNQVSGCRMGDTCSFAHLRDVRPHSLTPQTTAVCAFFATKHGCVKGDGCRFLHIQVRLLAAAVGMALY